MMGENKVLSSAQWISQVLLLCGNCDDVALTEIQNARDVKVVESRLPEVADTIIERMRDTNYSTSTWRSHTLHPKTQDEATVHWIFLVDLLNFSFWPSRTESKETRFTVTYRDQKYQGYWTLCACVNRALDAGIPLTNPSFFARMNLEQAQEIFRPDEPVLMDRMPLLEERVRVMRKAGQVLLEKYDGSFVNLVKECRGSVQNLLERLASEFDDVFNDNGIYEGRQVYFLKRAQILVADLWACFDGQGIGQFDDIDSITIFADYRVPQALVYFGLLEYSSNLLGVLEKHASFHELVGHSETQTDPLNREMTHTIPHGDSKEMEIRGCAIWAVELLRQYIAKKVHPSPNAILIDFYIWDFVTMKKAEMEEKKVPFHRTRSIYY